MNQSVNQSINQPAICLPIRETQLKWALDQLAAAVGFPGGSASATFF